MRVTDRPPSHALRLPPGQVVFQDSQTGVTISVLDGFYRWWSKSRTGQWHQTDTRRAPPPTFDGGLDIAECRRFALRWFVDVILQVQS